MSCRAYPGRGARSGARTDRAEGGDELAENPEGPETEDAVLLFVGGPLDGRVQVREARHGEPLPTITHVHLHGGPKVVHRYDLQPLPGHAGVYHLRQPAQRPVRDDVGD